MAEHGQRSDPNGSVLRPARAAADRRLERAHHPGELCARANATSSSRATSVKWPCARGAVNPAITSPTSRAWAGSAGSIGSLINAAPSSRPPSRATSRGTARSAAPRPRCLRASPAPSISRAASAATRSTRATCSSSSVRRDKVSLEWATYYDAADQAGQSRLWGGIHIKFDDFDGRRIGAQVGEGALDARARLLRAAAPSSKPRCG